MRFARCFAVAVAALTVSMVGLELKAAQFAKGSSADTANAVTVVYNPADGNLLVNGGGLKITTLEIKSASNKFNPAALSAGIFGGLFDVKSAGKLFTLVPNTGFGDMNMGHVLPSGLSADQLISDLQINGSILPNGGLGAAGGGGPFLYAVPEPSSIILVALGMLGLLGVRRK